MLTGSFGQKRYHMGHMGYFFSPRHVGVKLKDHPRVIDHSHMTLASPFFLGEATGHRDDQFLHVGYQPIRTTRPPIQIQRNKRLYSSVRHLDLAANLWGSG